IGALETTDAAVLFPADSSSAYGSGQLLFNREGTLMSQPFDAAKRVMTGDPFPVAESLESEGSRYASFALSTTGALVYSRGASPGIGLNRLTWFDRAGKAIGDLGEAAAYRGLALSPDERRVAATIASGSPPNLDIWTIDVTRGVSSRLTFDPWAEN